MKNGRLRIGFIGCGSIANMKHLPAMSMEDVDLCAFCDLIEERAKAAADKYGTPDAKVYTDYHQLLADPEIDAVHVLTPNVAHCAITVDSLNAGKHVICEKPMAATAEDAKKMIEARDRSGKLLTIGYQYRHFEQNKIAKKVVEDGWLGDIYYAEATNLRRRGVPTWGVFLDKEKQGGGPLIDVGTHALDLTLWMMNNYDVQYVVGTSFEKLGRLLKPEEQGQLNMFGPGQNPWDNEHFEVEDMAVGMIKMKNGAVINLRSSWAVNMIKESGGDCGAAVTLAGTKGGLSTLSGRVVLNNVIAGQPSISYIGKEPAPMTPPGKPERTDEARIWVSALKGEGELFVTADQACVVTQILDAIYESSRTNQPVYF